MASIIEQRLPSFSTFRFSMMTARRIRHHRGGRSDQLWRSNLTVRDIKS